MKIICPRAASRLIRHLICTERQATGFCICACFIDSVLDTEGERMREKKLVSLRISKNGVFLSLRYVHLKLKRQSTGAAE